MSRELQDKAEIVMKELQELLIPISLEIQTRRYQDGRNFQFSKNTGKME